jgi:hypothetical protein
VDDKPPWTGFFGGDERLLPTIGVSILLSLAVMAGLIL